MAHGTIGVYLRNLRISGHTRRLNNTKMLQRATNGRRKEGPA